jgi:hypothetical protein
MAINGNERRHINESVMKKIINGQPKKWRNENNGIGGRKSVIGVKKHLA